MSSVRFSMATSRHFFSHAFQYSFEIPSWPGRVLIIAVKRIALPKSLVPDVSRSCTANEDITYVR